MLAGKSALIFCSKTAAESSSTTLTQTEPPFGAAAMNKVSTPPDAITKVAPMSVKLTEDATLNPDTMNERRGGRALLSGMMKCARCECAFRLHIPATRKADPSIAATSQT